MTKTLSEELTKYRDVILTESWDKEMHTPKSAKGMFKGDTKEELSSQLSSAKAESAKLHKSGKPESEALKKKIKRLEFALRSKNNFGKVSESSLNESAHPKMEALLQKYVVDVDKFIESGFDLYTTSKEFQYALYEYYVEDMPYGTAKARTGDPDEFIIEHFSKYLEDNGLLPEESNMSPERDAMTDNMFDAHSDFQETDDPLYGYGSEDDPTALGESRTSRKCKGKGCDKKCTDGKNYCSKKCQSNTINLKKEVPIDKKLKESKFTPGPFSKKGYVAEAEDKKIKCATCKKETKVGYASGGKIVKCRDCWKKEKDSDKKKAK
jgi:hypothetical protein